MFKEFINIILFYIAWIMRKVPRFGTGCRYISSVKLHEIIEDKKNNLRKDGNHYACNMYRNYTKGKCEKTSFERRLTFSKIRDSHALSRSVGQNENRKGENCRTKKVTDAQTTLDSKFQGLSNDLKLNIIFFNQPKIVSIIDQKWINIKRQVFSAQNIKFRRINQPNRYHKNNRNHDPWPEFEEK